MSKSTSSKSASYWDAFFKDAGIPSALGSKYSVIFHDHRIHKDILGDLSRDILRDMGIKAMGDIIAILKQAQLVSDEMSRESTSKLITTQDVKSPPDEPTVKSKPTTTPTKGKVVKVKVVKPNGEKAPATSSDDLVSGELRSKTGCALPPPPAAKKPTPPPQPSTTSTAAQKSVFARLGEDEAEVFNRLGTAVVSSTDEATPVKRFSQDRKQISVKRKSVLDRLGPAQERSEPERVKLVAGRSKVAAKVVMATKKKAERKMSLSSSSSSDDGDTSTSSSSSSGGESPVKRPKQVVKRPSAKSFSSPHQVVIRPRVPAPRPLTVTPRPHTVAPRPHTAMSRPLAVDLASRDHAKSVHDRLGSRDVSSTTSSSSSRRPVTSSSSRRPVTSSLRSVTSSSEKPALLRIRRTLIGSSAAATAIVKTSSTNRKPTSASSRPITSRPTTNRPIASRPISSNRVSSTSAGFFKGQASDNSSVFDRLGRK